MNPVEEAGKVARSFLDALKDQPLSLALVVSNFVLLGYLFYSGSSTSSLRNETTKMVVEWQREVGSTLANCVSREVLEAVVGALERQLQEMRRQINGGPDPVPLPPPRPQEP